MTKKIFAMFLAVLMVVSMLPTSVFAAGCPLKGTNNHTVENCEWEVVGTTAPTCGNPGYTSYKCKACGEYFIDNQTEPTGEHTYEEVPAEAPTCEKPGKTAGLKCSVCGDEQGRDTIPALYTDRKCEWTNWTAILDCTVGGVKTRECKHCGAVEEEKVEKTQGHVWGDPVLVQAATATSNGKAVVACVNPNCEVTKDVDVFFAHTCDLLFIPQVDASCFEDGMRAHYECRVCGKLYGLDSAALNAAQIAGLVIKASHTWKDNVAPTCVKPTAYCTVCKANVTETVAHTVDWTVVAQPNCISTGFKTGRCTEPGCYYQAYEAIPALGHISQSIGVGATCGTYGYVFTYCLRKNCEAVKTVKADGSFEYTLTSDYVDGKGIHYNVEASFNPMSSVLTEMPLYFGAYDQDGKLLLLDGEYYNNKDYQLNITDDASTAVQFYVEAVEGVEGGYYIYLIEDGKKVYVETYTYAASWGTGYSIRKTENTPETYYTWNEDYMTLTTVFEGTEIFITQRISKGSYIYAIERKNLENKPQDYRIFRFSPTLDGAVQLVNIVIDYNGGFNPENHKTITVVTEPTCQATGVKYTYCANHSCPVNYSETVILDKVDHKYEKITDLVTIIEAGYAANADTIEKEATCTTPGYYYGKCVYCNEIHKKIVPATGHDYDDDLDKLQFYPGNHTTQAYYYWTCKDCKAPVVYKYESWEGLNHTWDTLAEAEAAHGALIYGGVYRPGDCYNVGLLKYVCSNPACLAKVVYVKQTTEVKNEAGQVIGTFITGQHAMPADTGYKAADCTNEGYLNTYKCLRCNAIIGNAPLGQPNKIPALGHDWVANKDYKAADCDKPNYKNFTHFCSVCGEGKTDGTKLLGEIIVADHCIEYTYTYYLCHCGKEHAINFVGELNHVWRPMTGETYTYNVEQEDGTIVAVTEETFVAPTCYSTGHRWDVCADCGIVNKVILATVEHVNKDNVKFTDKCTDTVEDRHCVVCHAKNQHDLWGNAHDCYTCDENKDKVLDCTCMIGKKHHWAVEKLVPSTCTTNAHYLKICADCGFEDVSFVNMGWNGHKPQEAEYVLDANGDKQYIYYANYEYVEYTWTAVEVVDGKFQAHTETYMAKMLEYVAPTYTSEGYFKSYCTECKMEVTQKLAKLAGLGIELGITNANGADEFVMGSLVEVLVSANGLEESVYGFDFKMNFSDGLVFVGYETLNEDFIFTVTNPALVKNSVQITAFAANDVNGKMQNIEITADTALVKLLFRVKTPAATTLGYYFENAKATQVKNNVPVAVGCEFAPKSFKTRAFLDFNKDLTFSVNDLYLAMSLLTGEHPTGKTYDVTMDLNKDGEVTLEELSIAYNYYVGNHTWVELFTMGMSDAEIELMGLNESIICNNSACQKVIDADATYCPYCGNHQ